jgi:nucleotide-binding universal stress UspA family protein
VAVVPPRADDEQRAHVVDRLAQRIQGHDPDTTSEVVDGRRPAVALLDYGHRLDNIVMAMASGQWTDGHAHLRSVTRKVTHRSQFPVLVIPKVYAPATSGRDR